MGEMPGHTTYAGGYNCTYDPSSQTFNIFLSHIGWSTFNVPNGPISVGDTVTVHWSYLNYASSGRAEYILIGTYEDGMLFFSEAHEHYIFLTHDLSLPWGVDFPVTTSGTIIVCFLAGTMVSTPSGDVAIETLRIGDLVTTADGEAKAVRWLAKQTVVPAFANPLKAMPIHIRASALADNLPLRDLFVSPDHALLIENLLVQAGALVNGSSIVRVAAMPERFTYYHLELDDHSLVLAEGVPAETFVDNISRRTFDNYAEFEALYGAEVGFIVEIRLPRVKSARQLPARIRARLEERAGMLVGSAAA